MKWYVSSVMWTLSSLKWQGMCRVRCGHSRLWKKLPPSLRLELGYEQFKRPLKTLLCGQCEQSTASVTVDALVLYNSIYLLTEWSMHVCTRNTGAMNRCTPRWCSFSFVRLSLRSWYLCSGANDTSSLIRSAAAVLWLFGRCSFEFYDLVTSSNFSKVRLTVQLLLEFLILEISFVPHL